MNQRSSTHPHPTSNTPTRLGFAAAALLLAAFTSIAMSPAHGAEARVDLGTAEAFSVLAATTVTNTGPSVLSSDLGLTPGSSVTGFPPGTVLGTQHVADAVAITAQNDLTTAYNDAAGRSTTATVTADLAGQTLTPGVYSAPTSLALNGPLTLNAEGDPNAVFILRSPSTLITGFNSSVLLVNGASPCNVFWQVGSSATLGAGTRFIGTVLALQSVTVTTGATVTGRMLARNGAVTLDTNVFTTPDCAASSPTSSPTTSPTRTPTNSPTRTPTRTPTATGTPTSGGPIVPVGNPPTGLGGAQQVASSSSMAVLLATLTALAVVGAAGGPALRNRLRRRG